jgi:hypothetical protein
VISLEFFVNWISFSFVSAEFKSSIDQDQLELFQTEKITDSIVKNESTSREATTDSTDSTSQIEKNLLRPIFILPDKNFNPNDTAEQLNGTKIFNYNPPANQDFSLDVKAIDPKTGLSGTVTYVISYISEKRFEVIQQIDPKNKILHLMIPAIYMDPNNPQERLIFSVNCQGSGIPKLSSEIVIIVEPKLVYSETVSNTTIITDKKTIFQEISNSTNIFIFNSSVVIVWEKYGPLARKKPTKLFSLLDKKNKSLKFEIWYDPKSFSLKLAGISTIKKQIFKLKEPIDILFVLFNENRQLSIYTDCPNIKNKFLTLDLKTNIDFLELGQNSNFFLNLNDAIESYKCNETYTHTLSVLPETLIRFSVREIDKSLIVELFNFIFGKETFTVNIHNQDIIVTKSGQEIERIKLEKAIHSNELFLVFSNEGLKFFVDCPYEQERVAFWKTSIFESKLTIKASISYEISNAFASVLLYSFCRTNFTANTIDINAVGNERKVIF